MLCVEAFNIRFELYWYPFFQHALLAIGPGSGADADGMLNCCFCKHPTTVHAFSARNACTPCASRHGLKGIQAAMRRCRATLSFKTARTVALTYLRCHFATAAKVRNPPNVLNDYVCFGLGAAVRRQLRQWQLCAESVLCKVHTNGPKPTLTHFAANVC